MTEAWFALAGVVVGAVIPVLTTAMSLRRQDARADADRQDARDARLFDHRRKAYAEYLAEARAVLSAAYDAHEEQAGAVIQTRPEAIKDLATYQSQVELYGTPKTSAAARNATGDVIAYAFGPSQDIKRHAAAFESVSAFAKSARLDLGVPSSE